MRTIKRWGLALALPTLMLLGCDGVSPMTPGQVSRSSGELALTSRLRAEVSMPRHLQSVSGLEVTLEIAYLGWEFRDVVVEPRILNLDKPTLISDLVPGNVTLTVTVRDAQGIHDRQKQTITLLPGEETPVSFSLVYGGSAALDLGVSYGTRQVDYRQLQHGDGFDAAFAAYQPTMHELLFWLSRESKRIPVILSIQYSSVMRRIGSGSETYYPDFAWTSIPMHAAYVDSNPLPPFTKVRHYRWTNQYLRDESTWTEVTVDRWYGASDGLLKEVISDGSGVVSTLIREGVEE